MNAKFDGEVYTAAIILQMLRKEWQTGMQGYKRIYRTF